MASETKTRDLQDRARSRGLHGRVQHNTHGRRIVCTRGNGHEGFCDGPHVDCGCRRCENQRIALGLPTLLPTGDNDG